MDKRKIFAIFIVIFVVIIIGFYAIKIGLSSYLNTQECNSINLPVECLIKKATINDLIKNDKEISWPKTEITMDNGGQATLSVGVRNKKNIPLHYKIQFTLISDPDGARLNVKNPSWFQFAQNQTYELGASDSDIRQIRLIIPKNISSGSYTLAFYVIDNDLQPPNNVYAKKDFSIKIQS